MRLPVTENSRMPAATPTTQFNAYRLSSTTPITAARLPTTNTASCRNGLPPAASRIAAIVRLIASSAKGTATKIARALTASQDVFSKIKASSSVRPALPHALRWLANVRSRKLCTISATTPKSSRKPDARSGSGAQRGVRNATTASTRVKMASAGLWPIDTRENRSVVMDGLGDCDGPPLPDCIAPVRRHRRLHVTSFRRHPRRRHAPMARF